MADESAVREGATGRMTMPPVAMPKWMLEPPGGVGVGTTSLDRIAEDMRALKAWMHRQSEATDRLLASQCRLEQLLEGTNAQETLSKTTPPSVFSILQHQELLDHDVSLISHNVSREASKTTARTAVEQKLDFIRENLEPGPMVTARSTATRKSRKQRSMEKRSFLEKVTQSIWFEYGSAAVILLHCIFIGAYVEYRASHDNDVIPFLKVVNTMLVVVFLLEVSLKIVVERRRYFTGHEKWWNIFDITLVLLVFVETLSGLMASKAQLKTVLKIAEIVRTARVLRIFRILNFSSVIKAIIAKIFSSISMLFWVLVLLGMLIFTVALVFTQGSNDFLDGAQHTDLELDSQQQAVHDQFGNIVRSAVTLFKAISCGMLWGDAWESLVDIGWFYASLFVLYVALTDFALLNIITGIFVDASMQTGMSERDLLEEKQMAKNELDEAGLREVFREIDDDDDGMLSIAEFEEIITQNQQLKVYMQALAIDVSDAKKLFKLLDRDNSGHINFTDFLEGCKKVRGEAKSSDIHVLLKDTKWLRSHIHSLNQKVTGLFSEMQDLRLEWAARC